MQHGIIMRTRAGVAPHKVATKQQPTTQPKEPAQGPSDTSLKTAMAMVDSWLSYRQKLMPMWERGVKLYNNERVKRNYEGITDTFVPMTFSTIETMVSALATGDLSTKYIPQDIYKYLTDRLMPGYDPQAGESEDDYLVRAIKEAISGGAITDETLEALNALYDYYWDCGDWSRKLEKFIKSGLKIGNGAWWETWEGSKPNLITVPFPDFIFDPNASDDDSCSFQGRRYLASLSDLRDEKIVDPETGKTRKRYSLKGVTKRAVAGTPQEKTDKELKEQMMYGSTTGTADDSGDQVEVIELRTKKRMYTIVNRKYMAEDVENPILSQAKLKGIDPDELILLPGITWANYEDDSLFAGKSETETFWQEQERLNDATNQKGDAVIRALLQNYRADPALKSQKNSFSVPGAVIWAAGNQYEAIPPAVVPNAAFNEEVSIKNNIRETTATDQVVKGVTSSSDTTATEAKLQVSQAGQRIEIKIDSLARGPLKRLARLTLQYVRLFVADPFMIPRASENGIKPILFDPRKYNYNFEPKVSLTIQAKGKQKQEQEDALKTYQILIQDPTNNLEEVKRVMLPKVVDLDKDEIDRIITQAPQAPVQGEAAMQGMAPQPMPAGAM